MNNKSDKPIKDYVIMTDSKHWNDVNKHARKENGELYSRTNFCICVYQFSSQMSMTETSNMDGRTDGFRQFPDRSEFPDRT